LDAAPILGRPAFYVCGIPAQATTRRPVKWTLPWIAVAGVVTDALAMVII
jgi:hypothetical protein